MASNDNFLYFLFLSAVFTPVRCAISHLKEDKISFEEKNILPLKLHVFLIMIRKWHTICINYLTIFDFETAWA